MICGPAAAILQIAHPRIEQGVHNHTNFRTDIMGRLRRTLESTNRIVFGRCRSREGRTSGGIVNSGPATCLLRLETNPVLAWIPAATTLP